MLTIGTEKGKYCLAPTTEEAVVSFAKNKIKSYRDLPTVFYQIGEKYRNELRTRGFLLRGKSFPMMDAYSFNKNEEDLLKSYECMKEAYLQIFKKLGLDVIPVAADSGSIGGNKSEEFMLISDIGEDTVLYDNVSGRGFNTEILERDDWKEYLRQEYGIEEINGLETKKAIELGHIFQLGTKYSEKMNATYRDNDGKEKIIYMGCYGIGVSRTLAAIYEKSLLRDKNNRPEGIALPTGISPYSLHIIPKIGNIEKETEAEALYQTLNQYGVQTIIDDRRDGTIGSKIKDCKILGTPYMAVLGDRVPKRQIEVEDVRTGQKVLATQGSIVKQLIELDNAKSKETNPELLCFRELKNQSRKKDIDINR